MYLILNNDKTFKIVADWVDHESDKEFIVISGLKHEKGQKVAEKKGKKSKKAKAI